MDLVCCPSIARAAQELARRWGRDRALSGAALYRLCALVEAAVSYGLRFDPRAFTITLQWLDPDRVRIQVTWKGCSMTATPSNAQGGVESTAATFDAYAEEWGFGTISSRPIQWVVLDTR